MKNRVSGNVVNSANRLAVARVIPNLRKLFIGAIAALQVVAYGPTLGADMSSDQSSQTTASHVVDYRTLDNGMQVVWEVDTRQPLVAIVALIKGGMRAEGPLLGTGVTHFLEHMLFKGTPTRAPGTIDQEVRSYGGSINAFTSRDHTGVTLYVESRYLEQGLEMVADILKNAIFSPEEFDKERDVIYSEIQMNLDNPRRRLFPLFWDTHLQIHPYKHPILGHKDLLYELTAEDLHGYYKSQYQPQNVTLSLVGDLEPENALAAVDRIFGSWDRGRQDPLQMIVPEEPRPVSPRRKAVGMDIQTAYVMLGFPTIPLSHPDLYALDVLAQILGSGASSRLHRRLVREEQRVQSIGTWSDTPYDPGAFVVQFKSEPEQIETALMLIEEEIEKIKEDGVTKEELAKAQRQVRAAYVFGLQTLEARASDLANSYAMTQNPLYSRTYVEGIEGVSIPEIQDAAIKYLDFDIATLVQITPKEFLESKKLGRTESSGIRIDRRELKNGMTALVGEDAGLPIITLVAAFKGGLSQETEANQGISSFAAQLLTKGTKKRNAEEIAALVESWGGSLEPFSGRDGFGFTLQVLKEDFESALDLVAEILNDYRVREDEVNLQKKLALQQIQTLNDNINHVAIERLRELHYGEHPYRFHPLGNVDSVSSFSPSIVEDFLQRLVVPKNTIVSVFGDIVSESAFKSLTHCLGTLPSRTLEWDPVNDSTQLSGLRTDQIYMQRSQAVVTLGFEGVTRLNDDRYALDVLTAVLSGMAGRLFQSIREEYGLAYTLGAFHTPGLSRGELIIYAATKPNEKERVLELLVQQLELLVSEGFTAEEVDLAKRHLIGEHRMAIQSLSGVAQRSTIDELYGLGYDRWSEYAERIQAVTLEDLAKVAGKYLDLDNYAQVTVAPPESNE